MDFFVQNMYIAILFPLWVSMLILIGKFTATLKSKKTILILTLISSIWGLISSAFVFSKVALNQNFTYESTIQFLSIQNLNFELGYYVDLLSTFMALIVFAVTLIVQIYAYFYMREDKSFVRFFTYFNFFLFENFIQNFLHTISNNIKKKWQSHFFILKFNIFLS